MRRLVLLSFLILLIGSVHAQSKSANGYYYKTALGVKVWDGAGISLKVFTGAKPSNAAEFIAYFYHYGMRITGLYEIHNNIAGAPGLRWYIGPGAHIGFYNTYRNDYHGTFVGIDGVIGLDYKFNSAPINLSLDWQPAIEFGDGAGFNGSWGGLGLRYTF
jgi:hypothetical protein